MNILKRFLLLLLVAFSLSGCAMATLDELYCLPKRSDDDENLQAVIDDAMSDLAYSAPRYGDNRQALQMADLDGDGVDEYILFAKGESDKPLKILIFSQLASGCVLMDTIEGYGFAFDFVTYAQLDDKPGLELIVGRQLSNQVMRSVSVYRFTSGFSRQLMNTSYNEITTTDMDQDGVSELFLLTSAPSDKSAGTVRLYSYHDGELQRSEEIQLSASMNGFKQMDVGKLLNGTPAIYVTCSADSQNLVTDVFVMEHGVLVSLVAGINTPAIDNYYVYPTDMDDDGAVELPRVVQLHPIDDSDAPQFMIQWYSLDSDQTVVNKASTYHNYAQNWYMMLDEATLNDLSVRQTEEGSVFYYQGNKLFTVMMFADADREEMSTQPGCTVLYGGETVIYVALIEDPDLESAIAEDLISRFHPIRVDLNTEED